jgi:hypothetical protein
VSWRRSRHHPNFTNSLLKFLTGILPAGLGDAVGTVLSGHVDGDALLGVLRILLKVIFDHGSLFEGSEAILGVLLDLAVVDLGVLMEGVLKLVGISS